MVKSLLNPDYIFESSWEVCNKVGGIYTVLSTRAKTLQKAHQDKVIFIGPGLWKREDGNYTKEESPYFREDPSLFAEWQREARENGLHVRVGRWTVPGEPIAILVDFVPYFEKKNEIYGWLWEKYQVDSLHAYGDYDEASMFSYAAALVVESFFEWKKKSGEWNKATKVIYHANEWMCGLGALYINNKLPQIGTIFTTHATSIGRSIAGNMKPLYDYLFAYNGDQMAGELNMQSKHSIEKQTAHYVDCFTTVSDITAKECVELLDKPVDVVLPNGFDDSFVPSAALFTKKRKAARKKLLDVANALLGEQLDDDTLIVSTSGRYEFRNKGIDVFVRKDLQERLAQIAQSSQNHRKSPVFTTPLEVPQVTHWLHNMSHDNVLGMLKYFDMHNQKGDHVKVIFLPCYLDGKDGILNMTYYDIVLGNDLCIYPSYYEPWGYTPLEAVAFKVPCITTDLAGFGLWANSVFGKYGEIQDGVKVIHRTDYNYSEVADMIKDTVAEYSSFTKKQVDEARKHAGELSKKALWSEFIKFYEEAYDIALRRAEERKEKIKDLYN